MRKTGYDSIRYVFIIKESVIISYEERESRCNGCVDKHNCPAPEYSRLAICPFFR
jgi:hypothetical protein